MSLQSQQLPLIRQGWLRAVLLFILYVAISIAAGSILSSTEEWLAVSFLLAVAIVYLFRRFVDRKSFESLGFTMSELLPHALAGLCLGTFLICTGTLIVYFLKGLQWIDIFPGMAHLVYSAGLLMLVSVAEELVFRGYVLRNLMKSLDRRIALFISSLLFTTVHASNPDLSVPAILNTFLAGLLMGITFIQTRNLWVPIFFHFSWNFLQGPVLGYPVSGISFESVLLMETKGNPFISGGEYGFEGSLVCSILLALSFTGWTLLERSNVKSYS